MAGLVVLAAVLRFWDLTSIPPGLYHDEARNGLDALSILDGSRPIYFQANNGREPFFIYSVALSVALLGRSPGAIRIVAALLGTLAVPATYLMAREMSGRRPALLAAALAATTVWPLALSRIGLRAISMPPILALALWLLWRGWRTGRRWQLILAGLCLGAASYTYLAARFSYIALLSFGIVCLFFRLDFNANRNGRPTDALPVLFAAILVLLPLIVYGVGHWDIFMGRAGQVSIFNPNINKGDFWGTLIRHTGRALGMFFIRGDFIPRHNVPLRPVFDPLIGAAFVAGLIRLVKERRQADRALILVWLAVMLLPTIMAEDAPHFLRAVGLQPLLFMVPALGLDGLWRWGERIAPRLPVSGLVAAILSISLGLTVRDYFFRYGADPKLRYSFEAAAAEMAVQANRFLGTGWQGEGLAAQEGWLQSGRRVIMDGRLWRDWPSVQYLVPGSPALQISETGASPGSAEAISGELLMLVWPYDEGYRAWLDELPPHREIRVSEGPLERGDLEETAYPLYAGFWIEPAEPTDALAHLEYGLELVDYQVQAAGADQLRVTLRWRATEPVAVNYTAFVQVLQRGQVIAQDDAPPGSRYLPTRWWRPGDVVVAEHTLELDRPFEAGRQIIAGLYTWPSLDRLRVLDRDDRPGDDYILLSP